MSRHLLDIPTRDAGPQQSVIQAVNDQTRVLDAFSNVLARIGYGSNNLLESTDYINTRLTRDFMLMVTLYRSNWLARKIIDVPAEDMCKNWYELTSKITPEQIDELKRVERTTRTRASMLQALKWGRLFGGGAAIILIDGHEDHLDEPLDLDEVMLGSYKGLLPLDRWSGITPGSTLVQNINSPDFGLPSSYRVTLTQGGNFEIHASRVLRFIGRDLPMWEKQAEAYWGISELEVVFDEIKKRDNTSFNIAGLVFLANIRVLGLPQLAETLALAPGAAQQALYNTLTAQNQLMSNMGMMVLPKDGTFDTKTYSFSGLNDIYESFMLDCSGAAEIPMTKLFGRSPAGMNATGESDMQNYHDSIGQKQETNLRPPLEKLLPVICMSTWGVVPEDLDVRFPSSQTVPMERLAQVSQQRSAAVIEAWNSDLLTKQEARKELRQMAAETGMFSNITDDAIANTPDEFQSESQGGGMGEGMPGEDGPEPGAEGQGPQTAGEAAGSSGMPSPDTAKKAGGLRGMLQSLRSAISELRGGKSSSSLLSLKEQIAQTRQDNEADTHTNKLHKAVRVDKNTDKSENLQRPTMDELVSDLKHTIKLGLDVRNWDSAEFNESDHPRDDDGKFGSGNSFPKKNRESKVQREERERKELREDRKRMEEQETVVFQTNIESAFKNRHPITKADASRYLTSVMGLSPEYVSRVLQNVNPVNTVLIGSNEQGEPFKIPKWDIRELESYASQHRDKPAQDITIVSD